MISIENSSIPDVKIIKPNIFGDDRGYFFESFNQKIFDKNLYKIKFVQDNESKSSYGVLRGLHFQTSPFEQSKLVRVIKGEIQDVAVDLRKKSPTYKKHISVILNDDNKKQIFIPKGFAHGFLVLSKSAIISYKVDSFYMPEYDSGILYNDPELDIKWNLDVNDIKLSEKDLSFDKYIY